jgi:hypothetical protein
LVSREASENGFSIRLAPRFEGAAPADDAAEDRAAVSGEPPGPVTVPRHVLPQQGTRAQQLDKLGQRIHWDDLHRDDL